VNGIAVYLLLLLVACGAPTLNEPDQAGRNSQASVADLLAATGQFKVGVLPGPVIVLQGERVSFQSFREFAISSGLPLKGRKALIKAHPDVRFNQVREVMKVLRLGECIDFELKMGDPLPESAGASSNTRLQRPAHRPAAEPQRRRAEEQHRTPTMLGENHTPLLAACSSEDSR
jgi:hypothetical protein